jgi:hypothetical protein
MDKPKTTPKDFFLWAGAMVTLYWSVVAFVGLLFDYINYAFPSATSYYPIDPYQSGISYEMASLIVLFPLAVVLMRFIHRDIRTDASRKDIWVRRWAIFLTLFVAGATIATDLIILLTSFLNGSDLTVAFLLKVVIVFLVAAAAFMHFIAEYRGYWDQYPSRVHMVGYATGVLALLTIVAGFFVVGTPAHARMMRVDADKVSDLQNIQSQIVSYWQAKQTLPKELADLNDSISGFRVPTDSQSGAAYTYEVTGAASFRLCADFNAASGVNSSSADRYVPTGPYGAEPRDNWTHNAGQVCFDRTIDPTRYPPYPTKTQQ